MLNNINNFFNLFKTKRVKKTLAPNDIIPIGVRDTTNRSDYQPAAIQYRDLLNQLVDEIGDLSLDVNIVFVSPNGDDNNLGTFAEPVQTLEQGKLLADSGDIVYVLPGTYFFDNTLTNGTPYNGFPEKVNLWKNGVTYYFSPEAKVVIWNNTNQENLYLFRPSGDTVNEKCVVRGYLDFESQQFGVSGPNGRCEFFRGATIGTDLGYIFDAEVNNLKSTREVIELARFAASATVAEIKIKFNRVEVEYLATGSLSTGTPMYLVESNSSLGVTKINLIGNYYSYKNNITTSFISLFRVTLRSQSEISINVQKAEQLSDADYGFLAVQQNASKNIFLHVNEGYFCRTLVSCLQGNGEVTVTGNYKHKPFSTVVFFTLRCWSSGSDVINFKGDITVSNTNGILAYTEQVNQAIYANANVTYIPYTTVGNNPIFRTNNGTINFTGLLKGELPLTMFYPRNGKIILQNAYVYNTQAVTDYRLMYNDTAVNSSLFINNSKIQINQNSGTAAVMLGNRIFVYLQNSYIVDTASTQILYSSTQTVANAKLYLMNSVLSSNGEAIDSTGEVTSVNSAVKVLTVPPVNLNGVIDVEPNLPLV